MIKKYQIIALFLIISFLTACSYSFTGASVPAHLKTIAIPQFKDNSGSGEPDLNSKFTFETIQRFIEDNTLQVTDKINADALIECTISRFSDTQAAITGNETVSLRRVELQVRVVYKDLVMKKTVFDQTFKNFADYQNDGDITLNRQNAIEETIEKISEDILLGVVSNW